MSTQPAASPAQSQSLEEVLTTARKHGTEPFCSSFGPIAGPGSQPAFAALITAHSALGNLEAVWLSEPMFGSPEAAVEHAEDMCCPDDTWPCL